MISSYLPPKAVVSPIISERTKNHYEEFLFVAIPREIFYHDSSNSAITIIEAKQADSRLNNGTRMLAVC